MIYSPTSKPEGTIRDWLNYHAKTSPNKLSYQFSDDGSELTWLELLNRVKLIANHLLRLNIRKGESIAICMSNGSSALEIFYAIIYGGFRVTPLNLAAGPAALGHAISHSNCNFIFYDTNQSEILSNALKETNANIGVSVLCPGVVQSQIIENERPLLEINQDDLDEDENAKLMKTMLSEGVRNGLEPSVVAERVFEAIDKEEFWIFTHQEFADTYKQYSQEILDSMNS